jgi:hypothetical protein
MGFDIYTGTGAHSGRLIDQGIAACATCHTIPTGEGTDTTFQGGQFTPIPKGPNGESHLMLVSPDGASNRLIKVPQTRNQADKRGFFLSQTESRHGFGLVHDGSTDTLSRFISEEAFDLNSAQELADLTAFVLSMPGSDLPDVTSPTALFQPPAPPSQDTHAGVGKQATISDANPVPLFDQADLIASMALMAAEPDGAHERQIDLVVKGHLNGLSRGWYYSRDEAGFESDFVGEAPLSLAQLRSLAAPGEELTFTLVPRGSGRRIGIDRDEDGYGDMTEELAGSNSADAGSIPQQGINRARTWELY